MHWIISQERLVGGLTVCMNEHGVIDYGIFYDRNDAKTVNVIAEACFSPVNKIAVTAIRFFLNTNEDEEEDESEEEVLSIGWTDIRIWE